uniref:Solute carrier family 29 member 1b n=1 Tax=Poecilia mexicana TaxID=48701 RepID=A0A3B3YXB8_9TELE
MGVRPTGLHAFCGLGEGVQPCPLGGSPGVWGTGPFDTGCQVPVWPVSVWSALPAVSRARFRWELDSAKAIWILASSVCFTFTVTIGTFPAITADTRSTLAEGGTWERYFVPVSCFLLFNLSDWTGRSLTAVCMWPGKDSPVLPAAILARVVFVPLFMLCNVQPRLHLPVFFHHDGFFIAFMILFAFSNGYLASLCMCYGPKNVLPHEAETAGAIMAFFLALGLAAGAAVSFLFRALV